MDTPTTPTEGEVVTPTVPVEATPETTPEETPAA